MPIKAKGIRDSIISYTREKSPIWNGLSFERYRHVPNLFDDLLADDDLYQRESTTSGSRTGEFLML